MSAAVLKQKKSLNNILVFILGCLLCNNIICCFTIRNTSILLVYGYASFLLVIGIVNSGVKRLLKTIPLSCYILFGCILISIVPVLLCHKEQLSV